MRLLLRTLSALAFCAIGAARLKADPLCAAVETALKSRVRAELEKGVPLELVGLHMENGRVVCRAVLSCRFSLWDRKVDVRRDGKLHGRAALDDVAAQICSALSCNAASRATHVRLLLNPIWEGRLQRLRARTEYAGQFVLSFDWERILRELPKENTLFEIEVRR